MTGTVLRADGLTPVPGAGLTLQPSTGLLRAEADSAGSYRFELVPAGRFTLTAQENGGPDAGLTSGTLAGGEDLVLNVSFNGTGTVEGRAFHSDGVTPASSGRVRLTRQAPFGRDQTANVGSDGSFQFLGIPVGTYTLSLTVTGSPLRGTASGEISADGDVVTTNIQLADAGSVLGTVLRADGAFSAPNTLVSVTSGGFTLNGLTDGNGSFRIDGIPLGSFGLRAEDPVSGGLAIASGAVSVKGEEVDVGVLVLDTAPIAVESVAPSDGATFVPPDSLVLLRFTDPVEPASLQGRFSVSSGGSILPGSTQLSAQGLELTFAATPSLPPSREVQVFVSKDLKDTLGRTLGSDFVSVFHTSGAIVTGLVFEGSVPVSGVSVTLTAGATAQTTTTDANGRYRFENVPLGRVTVEASDPITQKADSVVLDISATVGVVTADLSLAFVAGIEGQVFRFDGTPAGAGVEVSVLQGGTEVAFTTTDDTGFYRVSHVPLGSFTVDATHPANGDRGEARGSLTTSGQLVTVNVDLIGVGTVRLFVRDAADNLVPGAQASLSFTRFGQLTRLDNPTAEPDGSLLFVFVLAGPFTVEADDPATGLRATAIGTAVPASEVVVDLVLQLSGSIAATVFFPDGTRAVPGAAVELFRETGSLPKAEQTSDASGRVLFENVPVSESPYRIDVLLDGRLRARRRNVVVEENGQTSVTLQLIGLGTVTGQVIPPSGETLSSSVRVGLTSLAEDIGGFFSDPDGADGIYLISEIPVGPFTLSARDSFNGFLGEADGVITADGETVVIDVQLVDNAINLAAGKRLLDANEGDFRIQKSGSLLAGTDNLFAASDPGGLHLEVTVEGVTARFAGADVGSQEESGREIVTALEDIGGVRVRRKVFVPREGYFARYLEVLENLSPDAVAVSASVVSNLNNANGSPQIVSTSRGDTLIDGSDLWLITDDGEDVDPFLQSVFSIPATAWVLAGEATSLGPASVLFEENVGSSDGRLTVGYDLNLPAGSRVILMHFVSPQLSREAAREAALRLSALPPEALAGLSLEEIAAIANFQVPLDGTSPLAPLPAVNGRIAGQLFAHDGVTAVGTPTGAGTIPVKLQSSHILFRRERIANADAGGNFRFESSFTTSQSLAIPQVDFTLTASPNASVLKQAVATAAGSFSGGPSIVSDSPDLEASASSSASSTSGPEKAFDGFTSTLWVSATGDAANQGATPTLEMTLPAPVEVDFVRIDTSPTFNSEMFRVRLDLLGRAGQVLFTTDVDLPAPDRDLDLPLTPTPGVEGLRLISLNDLGSFVRVAEVEVRGVATSNVGSTLKDLIFHGTAAIAGVTRRVSGEPLASSLNLKSGAFTAGTISTSNGAYFFAPVPVEASPITVNATASVGHSLLKQTEQATLAADTTAQLDILFPETSSVSGRVLSASALPVPGKFVTLFPEFGSAISRSTDANGVYRFDDIPSGNYVLRVIQNSRLIDVPITVNAPTAVVQDIQIPDFGTLDLTVLFETAPGSPVAPAQSAFVTLTDSLGVRTGLTNPSGQLTFTHVAGPTFRASIRHPNNFNAFTQATGSIVEGQTLSLTVIIPAFGRVSGTVRFAGGSGASASQVDISGLGVTLQSRSTGFAGTYFFSNVEALRPFTVRARHPTTNRTHIFAEATGELGAQGATEAVDVTLPATGTVDVTVTEEDGTVIGGAAISIWDSFSTEFRSEGTTRFADGKASIAVVPEGSFTVRAEDSGNLIGEATGEITIDGEQVEIAIVRPRAAAVEGTILAGDGLTAVAGAPVALFSEDGLTLLDSTSSDDAGFYCFPAAVDPGTSALVRAEFPGDAGKSAEVMVSATHPGQTLTADLELPVSVVKGFVLDSDGVTPVAGASVEIQCEGTFDRRATVSNDAGRFVFLNEPPGAFELVAEDGFRLSAFFRTELHAGQLSLTQDIVLPPFGTIEGTVWDSGGAPLAGADVVLTSARLRGPRQVTPDGAGNFRFERVALGSFNLTFDMPTGELDELGQPILIPASVVGRLVAPGEAVLTNITVPPVGTLFGDVLSGGVPVVPGPETTLALEGRQNESSTGIYSRSVPVASDGSYLQEEVPAGDITATAVHAGEAGSAGATVLDGASTRLDVSLRTAVALPAELGPPAGRRHEVQSDGSMRGMVVGRSELTFSSLTVNAKPFAELASARWEPPDLQIVLGPIHTAGILHTRKVFVPDSAPFVRFLEILENPNALPVDVTFAVRGEIQASSLVTSSGDDRLDGADRYLAGELSDGTGVALVFAGTGTVRTPDATRTDGQSYQHVWRGLTVPAGGRVILVHFAVQADTLTNAEAQADALMTLSDSAAFSDLTAEERSQVVNFVVP
ncbi:MAG: carboxypeptidase regulatory-like domain-containing protein [Acidobacteriota bacterium]